MYCFGNRSKQSSGRNSTLYSDLPVSSISQIVRGPYMKCHISKHRSKKYLIKCVFILHFLLFPYGGSRKQALSSACKTDQADFTDSMFFLIFNFMEETSLNTKALSTLT